MKLADFTTIVINNVPDPDANANADQEVADAVNELSRYIQPITYTDENITADMTEVDRPGDAIKILRVYIPSEDIEIFEAKRSDQITYEKDDQVGYTQTQDKIIFTKKLTELTEAGSDKLRIVYTKAFSIPTGSVDFDGPAFLTEIIMTIAVEKYYRKFISIYIEDPTDFPEVTLHEIVQGYEVWQCSKVELLKNVVRVWESFYDSGMLEYSKNG